MAALVSLIPMTFLVLFLVSQQPSVRAFSPPKGNVCIPSGLKKSLDAAVLRQHFLALEAASAAAASKTPSNHNETSLSDKSNSPKVDGSLREWEHEMPSSSSSSSPSPVSEVVAEPEYPWSKAQEWALRDNLPKYIIRIPLRHKSNQESIATTTTQASRSSPQVISSYALWRSLLQDVPELAGYPVDILQAKYMEQCRNDDMHDSRGLGVIGVLPYLQDYEFSTQGGVCGTVYGLVGVADGSRIETSDVVNVQETLPKGYIQTRDGSAAFELGRPISEAAIFSGKTGEGWKILSAAAPSSKAGAKILQESAETIMIPSRAAGMEDADGLLIRLGATTGILLAGAAAINMISHHMTVNVFWV
jgi:hypothetical protein